MIGRSAVLMRTRSDDCPRALESTRLRIDIAVGSVTHFTNSDHFVTDLRLKCPYMPAARLRSLPNANARQRRAGLGAAARRSDASGVGSSELQPLENERRQAAQLILVAAGDTNVGITPICTHGRTAQAG